jgi:Protein of unknown function (DUF1579)
MYLSRAGRWAFGFCLCVVATGCMPKMTIDEMKAMMPERPPALDKLKMFVGSWNHEGVANFAAMDEPLKMKAHSTATLEGDGWYLVERATYSMDGFDDMMGLSVWTYDMAKERFRVTYFDTMGSQATGTATYDDDEKVWRMRVQNASPFGTSTAHATVTFEGTDKQKWTWTESAMFGLFKIMDMEATLTRQ